MNKPLILGLAAGFGIFLFKRNSASSLESAQIRAITGSDFEPNLEESFAQIPVFPAGEPCHNWGVDIERWRSLVAPIAESYQIPVALVMGLIWTESNGNPEALGDVVQGRTVASFGLMQVSRAAAQDGLGLTWSDSEWDRFHQPCAQSTRTLNPVDLRIYSERCEALMPLLDPETNIRAGCAYLAWLKRQFPGVSWRVILAAYNWGIGNVQRVHENFNAFPVAVQLYVIKTLDRANRGSGSIYRPYRACCETQTCGG